VVWKVARRPSSWNVPFLPLIETDPE